MEEKIKATLEELRPMLQADGGDMELVKIDGKSVFLRMRGACGSCPYSQMTIKNGIERALRSNVDDEIVVEQVR